MPSYVTPKYATAYILYVSLVDQSNTKLFKGTPTLASGDFKVSIDGGTLNNLSTLPTVTPASGKMVKISLSTSEMTGDNITVVCSDASGAEWCDLTINLQTSARQIDDLAYPATSGRSTAIDASGQVTVGAIAANAITAASINADAITDAKVASDVTIASVTGAVGSVTGAVGSVTAGVTLATDAVNATALATNAVTELQSGLATAASIATLQTSVDDLPTNAELATSQAAADDATLSAIAALNNISVANILAGVIEGSITLKGALRLALSVLTGKSSGGDTTTVIFRDTGDTKDRVTATVDGDGNRSAVTRDITD